MTCVVQNLKLWKDLRKGPHFENRSVGFVPTMGALHDGHRSLLQRCKRENDLVVLSIFVNRTQFNDPRDERSYPRSFEDDFQMANDLGVDYLLHPDFEDVYPDNYRYAVTESKVSRILCGQSRPGHFDGVLTVVLKFLILVNPTRAYFGEKDYQQYLLVKDLAASFHLDTTVVPCSIVRDSDGLALSSRNQLLTEKDRLLAAQFPQVLKQRLSKDEVRARLEKLGFKVDYVEDIDDRRFSAVHVGNVRLIDNVDNGALL